MLSSLERLLLIRVKKCDLASFASIREFCRQVINEERRVDILVNRIAFVS